MKDALENPHVVDPAPEPVSTPQANQPSRRRWLYLGLLFGSTLLNYLDRQTLSVLKPMMSQEFGFTNRDYSLLVTVFMVPYIVMYLLSGPLVDRFGSRICMTLFVGVWSLSTLVTGFVKTTVQLGTARFFLGLAEPGNMPAAARAATLWFSAGERGLAVAIFSAGSAIGSIIALPLSAWIATHYGWRAVFFVLGACGVVWASAWWLIFREPASEKTPNAAPVQSWGSLFKDRSLLAILVARMISDPVWYFMLFWLPTFFQEKKGLSLAAVGVLGWIPFLFADLGGIAGGHWADRMIKSGVSPIESRVRVLRRVAWAGLAGGLLALGLDVMPALIVFSIVGVACMTWFFVTAALLSDLFPAERVAGALGIVAAAGALGATVFNALVGTVVDTFGFPAVFCALAILHPCAALVVSRGVRDKASRETTAAVATS